MGGEETVSWMHCGDLSCWLDEDCVDNDGSIVGFGSKETDGFADDLWELEIFVPIFGRLMSHGLVLIILIVVVVKLVVVAFDGKSAASIFKWPLVKAGSIFGCRFLWWWRLVDGLDEQRLDELDDELPEDEEQLDDEEDDEEEDEELSDEREESSSLDEDEDEEDVEEEDEEDEPAEEQRVVSISLRGRPILTADVAAKDLRNKSAARLWRV